MGHTFKINNANPRYQELIEKYMRARREFLMSIYQGVIIVNQDGSLEPVQARVLPLGIELNEAPTEAPTAAPTEEPSHEEFRRLVRMCGCVRGGGVCCIFT